MSYCEEEDAQNMTHFPCEEHDAQMQHVRALTKATGGNFHYSNGNTEVISMTSTTVEHFHNFVPSQKKEAPMSRTEKLVIASIIVLVHFSIFYILYKATR